MEEYSNSDILSVTSIASYTGEFESQSDQSETNSVRANVEVDVRTFKENDNDQNNNVDDLALKCNNSKDITEDTVIEKIREETRQICSLLPKFTYYFVYNKLCRLRYAQNRVEICLWNLLPDQVPKAKWLPRFNNGNSTQKTLEMLDLPKKNTIKHCISSNSPNINVERLLNNYLTYFQFMQHNKRGKLGSAQHFDISERNDIRTRFLTSQCENDKKNTFESVYEDPEPGMQDFEASETEILDVDANEPEIVDVDANKPEILDVDANSVSFNASRTVTEITAPSIHKNTPRTQTTVETTLDNTDLINFRREQVIAGTKKKRSTISSAPAAELRVKYSESGNIKSTLGQPLKEAAQKLKAGRATQNKELCAVKTDTQAEKQEMSNDCNNHFIYLSGLFPNADSQFLKRVVLRTNGNYNKIRDFVEGQCKEPTYPTKGEKLKRTEITKQQKQYTIEFDVKHFLKIFPNPFLHFENANRKCTYHPDAIQFLQFYFNQFNIGTLSEVYQKHNYHLTLAAQELGTMSPDRQSNCKKSMWERNPTEHIPLLQECAFIKYKNEIREYLDKLIVEEEREFQNLKRRNELLECACCFNNECMPSKCATCDDGHVFCHECIIKGVELTIAQGGTRIKCFVDSTDEFSLPTLQELLQPSQFSVLIRKRQEAEVKAADLEGLVSCPFCHFASIPPKEDKVFKCFNPECMKESCRLCKELNHVPLKCNDKSENARIFLEEKMTEAIVRKCFNCGRPYIKEYGCNRIYCSCGATMCYLCNKQISGYEHFNGSCPLHTNDEWIDNRTVEEVAKKTVAFIKSKDPNIKINTTGLVNKRPSSATVDRIVIGRLDKVKFDASY